MRSIRYALCHLVFCLLVFPLSAQTIDQPDFTDLSALTITPTDGVPLPMVVAGELRLTEDLTFMRGAVFKTDKVKVNGGFGTSFTFRLEQPDPMSQGVACPPASPGGDGLAFVVQNHSLTKVGSAGFGLSYGSGEGSGGIESSVAVEFDTWQNVDDEVDGVPMNEANDNHVSVQTLGASANSPHPNASLVSTMVTPDMNDGSSHTARVSYSPGKHLKVEIDEVQVVDLANFDLADHSSQDASGNAWVGFTSATGACHQVQILEEWTLFLGLFENGFEQGDLGLWSSVIPQ